MASELNIEKLRSELGLVPFVTVEIRYTTDVAEA